MKKDLDFLLILWITIFAITLVVGLICLGISIYVTIKYGNCPVTEIPSWALLFMFKR